MSISATTQPRWVSAPGSTIAALLDDQGLSVEDLADRLELSDPDARRLLRGELALGEAIAQRLAASFGGSVDFWLQREAQYLESSRLVDADELARDLPSRQLEKFGWMPPAEDWVSAAELALAYFGFHNVREWRDYWEPIFDRAQYRTSNSFENKPIAIAAWLRHVGVEAQHVDVEPWSASHLREILPDLRSLTKVADPEQFYPKLRELLAAAGVALVIAPAPDGCVLSGAAFRADDGVRVIGLTARHLSDDHLWFTLFHELGHLLLHDGPDAFLDALDTSDNQSIVEAEADSFAQDVLVPGGIPLGESKPTLRKIILIASRVGVAPGIVLGQLQHAGVIPYPSHSRLKRRYRWDGTTLKT